MRKGQPFHTSWRTAYLTLVLLVSGAAHAHEGNTNRAPWDVCEDAERGDVCEFVDHHETLHRGTCRSFDGELTCARNRPLIPLADASPPETSGIPATTAAIGLSLLACLLGLAFFWRVPTTNTGRSHEQ